MLAEEVWAARRGRLPSRPPTDVLRRADVSRLTPLAAVLNPSVSKTSVSFSLPHPAMHVLGLVPRSMEVDAVLQADDDIPTVALDPAS